MNVTEDLSILSLIANASLLVKLVMALLGTVSFMSWYWIFRKWFAIRDAKKKTDLFERDFWSGGDLNALYQSAIRTAASDQGEPGALHHLQQALRESNLIDSQDEYLRSSLTLNLFVVT